MIRAPRPLTMRWAVAEFGDWLLTVLIAQLTIVLVFGAASPIADKAMSIACCMAMIITGLLRRCARSTSRRTGVLGGMRWSLAVAAGACALIIINTAAVPDLGHVLAMGTATFVLGLAIAAVHECAQSYPIRNVNSGYYLAAVVVLMTVAPLWLGPWADGFTIGETMINGIIATSPLSYLAVMADYDYLRSAWFYQHTPVGMLRYDYLPSTAYSGCWLLVGVTAFAAPRMSAWMRSAFRRYVAHKHDAKATGDPAS